MGEDFKSKGEGEIAGFLSDKGIKYFYEHPVAVVDGKKTKIWYPDFTLPEYGIIIEYAGMDNYDYYDKMTKHKKEVYKNNGIEAIFLLEESLGEGLRDHLMNDIGEIVSARFSEFQRLFLK